MSSASWALFKVALLCLVLLLSGTRLSRSLQEVISQPDVQVACTQKSFEEDEQDLSAEADFTPPDVNVTSAIMHTNTSKKTGTTPRFLWGIFSMNSPQDKKRRQMIRQTYLSYYQQHPNASSIPHKICSLRDYQNTTMNTNDCQLIYAFVLGSNPHGSPDLCNVTDVHYPLTTKSPPNLAKETDLVHLNLRENMNAGKSPSWFKYGVQLADNKGLDLDYIVKLDADTLIFPEEFLRKFHQLNLPTKTTMDTLVFGGYTIKGRAKFENKWLIPQPHQSTKSYMSGSWYFLSLELARYVTNPYLNRDKLEEYKYVDQYRLKGYTNPQPKGIGHEDLSMANYVFSHPHPELILKADFGDMLQTHMKEIGMHAKEVTKDMASFRRYYQDNVRYPLQYQR